MRSQREFKNPFKLGDTYYVVIVSLIYSLYNPSMRAFAYTISGFDEMPRKSAFILALFIVFCRFCTLYGTINVLEQLAIKFHFPIGILIAGFMFLPIFFQVLDFEDVNSQRETSMRQTASALQIFQFRPHPLFKSKYEETGRTFHSSGTMDVVERQLASKPGYYSVYALAMVTFALCYIVFIIVKYREILISFGFNLKCSEKFYQRRKEDKIWKKKWVQYTCYTAFAIALALFITFLALPVTTSSVLQEVAPSSWILAKSTLKPSISKSEEKKQLKKYREFYQLPEGEEWIDQRKNPVYPLVHGPKAVADAYKGTSSTTNLNVEPDVTNAPNIVFVAIESLTPSPFYMNNDLLADQNSAVFSGKMYDNNYFPNLNKLQEFGPAFSGLSSQGFPTYAGWMSLVAGQYQQDYGISMVMDRYNDLDDLPSFARQYGYHSTYLAASPPEFDLINNYAFRGNKHTFGPKFLEKLPRWFDQVHCYFPTNKQFEKLDQYLDEPKPPLARWASDRITSAQAQYHSYEYYKESSNDSPKKPLFTVWSTIDMHSPQQGYDSKIYYDKFKFGKGLRGGYNLQERFDRFSTLSKYTDAQVGKLIDFYQTQQPGETSEQFQRRKNTIIMVCGDHGVRDVNAWFKTQKIVKCAEGSFQSGYTCSKNVTFHYEKKPSEAYSGNDEAFVTTMVMGYLGDNETLKQQFGNLKNQVYTYPTDHMDVGYTFEKIISEATGRSFVSSRQGRDLLEIIPQAKSNTLANHISVRSTGFSMEYCDQFSLTRAHSYSGKGGFTIEKASYPTSIVERNQKITSLSKQEFQRQKKMIGFIQKINMENRLFSYQFRDFSCVQNGNCKFPTPNRTYTSPSWYMICLVCPFCLSLFSGLVGIGLFYLSKYLDSKGQYELHGWGWKKIKGTIDTETPQDDIKVTDTNKEEANQEVIAQ